MITQNIATVDPTGQIPGGCLKSSHFPGSAVSWSAVFAGAAAAAALSLIFVMLGVGLELCAVSPWQLEGITAVTFGVSAILWITLTQTLAAGMGGYLAGRLRTKWLAVHKDEVYFRDTAHGFLSWAVATLASAMLLTTAIGSILNSSMQNSPMQNRARIAEHPTGRESAVSVEDSAAGAPQSIQSIEDRSMMVYLTDMLLRKDPNSAPGASASALGREGPAREVSRILLHTVHTGALPAEDARYVSHLVATHTGLTQQEAEKRVAETYARMQTSLQEAESVAKQAIDDGRKASAYITLWIFISLLMGAFFASLGATFGGRRRDA